MLPDDFWRPASYGTQRGRSLEAAPDALDAGSTQRQGPSADAAEPVSLAGTTGVSLADPLGASAGDTAPGDAAGGDVVAGAAQVAAADVAAGGRTSCGEAGQQRVAPSPPKAGDSIEEAVPVDEVLFSVRAPSTSPEMLRTQSDATD